jgi:oxidoreductase
MSVFDHPVFNNTKWYRYIGLLAVLFGIILRADWDKILNPISAPGRKLFDKQRWTTMTSQSKGDALVIGATGAVGQHVVTQLCDSSAWGQVTCLLRRPLELDEKYKKCVVQKVVGSDAFEAALGDSTNYKGQKAVFCTLATTRDVAGTAENFYKIDHDYVKAAADAAAAGGVRHFSVVTVSGAKDGWAPTSKIFHPFFYLKTKWDVEQSVIAANFASTAIFRPGLLNRGDKASGRMMEKFALKFMKSLPVEDVAKAMILKAEENLDGLHYYEDDEIRSLAKLQLDQSSS